jgi:hypothetical protein
MVGNDQVLDQLNKRFDTIEKNMATKQDIQRVEKGQEQTNNSLAHIITAVEAGKAGQDDIREKMATKADIHRLEQKIDKVDKHVKSHESRIDNLEEEAGLPNPHKN